MWREESADEVALSIAENGYYPQDPLFVIPSDEGGKYVVVEGNRRLAAVKLLTSPGLREEMKASHVPELPEDQVELLQVLPVWVYPDRESLWEFLGFKHINGAKPWSAFSKAAYIASVHTKYGHSLDKIAKSIGDRHSTVQRLFNGHVVLAQANEQTRWNTEDRWTRRLAFSHLYTALDQGPFQTYLSLTPGVFPVANPVPEEKLSNLEQLCIWLYGQDSTGTRPLIASQNPDLNRLRDAIAEPEALALLQAGGSLDEAYSLSRGDERRLRESLGQSVMWLRRALAVLPTGYDGTDDELRRNIERVSSIAQAMKQHADSNSVPNNSDEVESEVTGTAESSEEW